MQPLAMRLRPTTLDDIIGQQHIIGKDMPLRKMIEADVLSSIILYGPPGTGKTTIASVIANTTNADFIKINAVSGGKKDIENAVTKAAETLCSEDRHTILFIDEIHRFNKAQQDYLLPFVEDGTVILIGATTENPYFEVNPALISRSTVFELKPVDRSEIRDHLINAMYDMKNGLGNTGKSADPDVFDFIAEQSNGDVRHALQILELSTAISKNDLVTIDDVKVVIQKPHIQYDKDGDKHYDTISAFIKSMRGSDPNATLYYLAKMLEAGEDPKFIARRIMIHASEDVGLADPMAICVAASAAYITNQVGMPECRISLANAALYIALAPKSNSSAASIDEALQFIKDHPENDQPDALKDAHYKSAKKLGHGVDYKYPHDFPDHFVLQQYMPDSVAKLRPNLYKACSMGQEKSMIERLKSLINKAVSRKEGDKND